jgi:putative spermidine/putrescine transport system permease protein
MVFPKILKVEETWLEVGMMLGVNKLYFFRKVVFELIKFDWITTCFIVFAFTFSEFEIPYMLGVTYPKTLSVLSYNLFINGMLSERPIALGINVIVTIITLAVGVIGFRITRNKRKLYD